MEIKKEHLILGAVVGGVTAAVAGYMLATRAGAAPAPAPPSKKVYETKLSISAPQKAYVNEPFGVMGSLLAVADSSTKPLEGETIEIYVDGQKVLTTTTGGNGVFDVNITIYKTGSHTITARYLGKETADAVYKSSEASATVEVVEKPAPQPPPQPPSQPQPPSPAPQPTVTISASKNELREDPADYVTVKVCWSNYDKGAYPPDSGDYYKVGAVSESENCVFDDVLIHKDKLPAQGCAEFTRRFLDEFISGTGSWYYPCLGVLRGFVGKVKSQNTVTVNRVLSYSINDVAALDYDKSTGTVDLILARDVKNMIIIFMAWTEDEWGAACRGLVDPNNTAATKGLWITSTGQRFHLFNGVYPRAIDTPIYSCIEKYVVVRVYRPDGRKEFKVQMRAGGTYRTRLSISVPDKAVVNQPFTVSGKLTTDGYTAFPKPVANATIEIYVNDQKVATTKTGSDGTFSVTITISRVGTYTIKARHPAEIIGEDGYISSEATATITVVPS